MSAQKNLQKNLQDELVNNKGICNVQICGRKFGQQGHLNDHMAVHSEQKAYSCEHCGKSFRFRRSHKRHKDTCPGND